MGPAPAPRKILPEFEAELGFSGIRCIMFSGNAFPSAPLSTTADIFTIPFLLRSSATCPRIVSLSSSHSDPRTVPLLSKHPRRLEHCWRFHDLRVTTECITQCWCTAHQTRLANKVPQSECLVVLFGPAAVFVGVFSFRRVLLQVINPSCTGAQPRGVSKLLLRPLPLAFHPLLPLPVPFSLGFPMALFLYPCPSKQS